MLRITWHWYQNAVSESSAINDSPFIKLAQPAALYCKLEVLADQCGACSSLFTSYFIPKEWKEESRTNKRLT